jgi:hypothetical protein
VVVAHPARQRQRHERSHARRPHECARREERGCGVATPGAAPPSRRQAPR